MSALVYGSSDDLVEVEGDIREEFNCYDEHDGAVLVFSTGAVLRIVYDAFGMWRIKALLQGEGVSVVGATDRDRDYSDKATVAGLVKWVIYTRTWDAGGLLP
jgi:hypothetical protein